MPRRRGDFTKKKGCDDARSRAWRAMDVLGIFTIPQVRMASDISEANLQKYLNALHSVGIVRKIKEYRYRQAGAYSVWKLLAWTGPLAPMAMRDGRVYDPNTKKILGEMRHATAV